MFVFSRRKRVSLSGCYGVQILRGKGIGRDKQWTFMIDFERWSRSFDGRKWLVRRDPRRSKGLCRINSRSFRLLRPSHWSQNVIEGRRGVSYVIRGQRTRWLYNANTRGGSKYASSGVGAIQCRHQFVLPNGVGDLQKGERCVLSV